MKIACGMIVLNEEQFIGAWLRHHYEWFERIVIVEGADFCYPHESVTDRGLSVDRTAEIIRDFPDIEKKITFIQHGWAGSANSPEGYGKVVLRDVYARTLAQLKYDQLVCTADADEFFRLDHQKQIMKIIHDATDRLSRLRVVHEIFDDDGETVQFDDINDANKAIIEDAQRRGMYRKTEHPPGKLSAFRFPTLHFYDGGVLSGGYFDVEHTRFWKWSPGHKYVHSNRRSHNSPVNEHGKSLVNCGSCSLSRQFDVIPKQGIEEVASINDVAGYAHSTPCCHHFGFMRPQPELKQRNRYYQNRGEENSRPSTIADRYAIADGNLQSRGISKLPWAGIDIKKEFEL